MKSHYDVLGVAQSARPEVIRAAWRALVKLYHPDHNKAPEATAILQSINVAYEVLSDPRQRADYDRLLEGAPAESTAAGSVGRAPPRDGGQGWTDAWEHQGVQYRLHYQPGVVREHREWVHYEEVMKTDGRLFVGIGRYPCIVSRPQQQIWLDIGGRDELVQREGEPIPVAASQVVTLVSLATGGGTKTIPIVLINRATQQWHQLTDWTKAVGALGPRHRPMAGGGGRMTPMVGAVLLFVGGVLLVSRRLPWSWALLSVVPLVMVYGLIVSAVRTSAAVRAMQTHLSAAGIS